MIVRLRQSAPLVGLIRIFASSAFTGICLFVLYSLTSSSSFQSVYTFFPISPHHYNKREIASFASLYYLADDISMGGKDPDFDGINIDVEGPVYKRASLLLNPTYPIPPSFSLEKSTEENYGVENLEFFGPFKSIRASLDYSYHGNYTESRQLFQDRIVEKLLDGTVIEDSNGRGVCKTPNEPWIVFTAGVMGAGKSHTIKQLASRGLFPLQSYVVIDPDDIRQHFPEYCLYAMQSPEHAGELTHKEAGYVTEIVTAAALQRGHNVLVDGSLWDHDWYREYFEQLKKNYGNLRIAILHITAPREAVCARAKVSLTRFDILYLSLHSEYIIYSTTLHFNSQHRAKVTGRVVPIETLELSLKHVPQSIKLLAPMADFFCELDNSPDAKEVVLKTEGITWDSFRDTWAQTCPYPTTTQRGKM
jgi:predicted kinase